MENVSIDREKQRAMEKRLDCTFCDDGIFSEMILGLSDYREKTRPIDGIDFGFYKGDINALKETVALVDKEWVQFFDESCLVFGGFSGESLVSFCIVDIEGDCILADEGTKIGAIGCVGTIPKFRKLGIGLRMVDLATGFLKENGCDKSSISYTHIDKWYAKLGYQTYAKFSLNN